MECAFIECRSKILNREICRKCLEVIYCSELCRNLDYEKFHRRICKTPTLSLNEFLLINQPLLGHGTYGQVKLIQHIATKNYFALKSIDKRDLSEASLKMIFQEIFMQRQLIHPNVIRLHGHLEDPDTLYLILDYAEKGNLFKYVQRKKRLDEKTCWRYFTQICAGAKYLHGRSIIHRDLKLENVLITKSNTAKICDFGWSSECSNERSTYCGTLDYMAPEIIEGRNYTNKVDIWALGVLLYEMTHGYSPFVSSSDHEKRTKIAQGIIRFSRSVSSECKELIQMMMKVDSESRPDIIQVLSHSWVEKYAAGYSSEVFCIEDLQPGNRISINGEIGEIFSVKGLVCEVRFLSKKKEMLLVTELELNNCKIFPKPANRATVASRQQDKAESEFDLKLTKNYPPSYKVSETPTNKRRRMNLSYTECQFVAIRRVNENKNNFSDELMFISESNSSLRKVSYDQSECSFADLNTLNSEIIERRRKELESLQLKLEGGKNIKKVPHNSKEKKGLFSKLYNIFKMG